MFTPAFRFFAGLAAFSFVAAFVVAFTSIVQSPLDRVLGPLTLGWKGGVGEHFGYTYLIGLGTLSAGLAGILVAFRDADPEAEAQVVHTESVPLTRAPAGTNYMPPLAAFSFVLTLIGLATDATGLAYAGVALAVVVGITWTFRTWAERATGDDAVNAELYHRFIDPLRVPVVAIISIAFVVLGLSRVLLAVSKVGSVVIFGAVAAVFFVVAALLALYPKSTRTITAVLMVIGAILILVAGIIGAIAGERDIEHHGEETEQEATEGGEALAPSVVVVTPAPAEDS